MNAGHILENNTIWLSRWCNQSSLWIDNCRTSPDTNVAGESAKHLSIPTFTPRPCYHRKMCQNTYQTGCQTQFSEHCVNAHVGSICQDSAVAYCQNFLQQTLWDQPFQPCVSLCKCIYKYLQTYITDTHRHTWVGLKRGEGKACHRATGDA